MWRATVAQDAQIRDMDEREIVCRAMPPTRRGQERQLHEGVDGAESLIGHVQHYLIRFVARNYFDSATT